MTDVALRAILPQFVAVFLIACFWQSCRYPTFRNHAGKTSAGRRQGRLEKAERYVFPLALFFSLMTVVYAYCPSLYRLFFPVESLNEPLLNSIGVTILRASLAWVFICRLLLKRALTRYRTPDTNHNKILAVRRGLIMGVLIMFTEMATTLFNLVGIVLCNLACIVYAVQLNNPVPE